MGEEILDNSGDKLDLNQLELYEITLKFLKYQDNIKSCSPLTTRHYALDLAQIFDLDTKILRGNSKSGHVKFINEGLLIKTAMTHFTKHWSKFSPATRNRKTATTKSFLNWLFENQYIKRDLSLQITCPKVPKKIPHFISVDEVFSIISFLNHHKSNHSGLSRANLSKQSNQAFQGAVLNKQSNQAFQSAVLNKQSNQAARAMDLNGLDLSKQEILFYLLYGCGLRISEACSLTWGDINLSNRSILIKGKGSKERIAIAPKKTIELLKAFKKNIEVSNTKHNQFIFGGKSPVNTRIAYQWIRNLGASAGLMTPLNPHALRHSFATHMLGSGANLRVIQSMLGHESLLATEKYTHLSIDQLARTVESCHPLSKKTLK